MATWYEDSLLILHYEHNYSPEDPLVAGSGIDAEQIRGALERVRPDVVEYTAKGSAGYVPYATLYGNALPALEHWDGEDLLELWRAATRESEVRFVVGYAGLTDRLASVTRPDWLRLRTDGNPYPNRALCPNTSYVDELLLPQLAEIVGRYEPDGVLIDQDNWSVSPCYCSACEAEYRLLHARTMPASPSDAFWEDWLQFHRDAYERYLGRVSRYLGDRGAELVLAFCGVGASHQPGPAPSALDRLSRDLSPAYSLRQAGLEARVLASKGVPFDLGLWTCCSARPWPQGRLPALPAYPKSLAHLAQETAAVLAHGGRVSLWVQPHADDALPGVDHRLAAEVAEFARARRAWSAGTETAAYVAVVHSEATHRKAGNGLFDPGPSLDRVRGASQALQELHHPFDVVDEDALLRELGRYRVVVLPEQVSLSTSLDDALLDWVRAGGRLLATGRVSPRIVLDVPTFALEDALGVQWTGRQQPEGWVLHRGEVLRIAAPFCLVNRVEAQPYLPLLRSGHEHRQEESEYPAATRRLYGDGEVFYVAADLFAAYHRHQYPGLRDLIADLLRVALPELPVRLEAPPTVELVLREGESGMLAHLVNLAPGKNLAQNSPFIEEVPPTPPMVLELRVVRPPTAVRLQPEERDLPWTLEEDVLRVEVPPVHLHAVVEMVLDD